MVFVDANRAAAINLIGQKDNKSALDKRKKEMVNEQKNYKNGNRNDDPVLEWEAYYNKVQTPYF